MQKDNAPANKSSELAEDDRNDEQHQNGDDGNGDHPICSHPGDSPC
jgi:hypothetical protein